MQGRAAPERQPPFDIRRMAGESMAAVWARRALSVPLVVVLGLVAWLLAPLWLTASVAADVVLGPRWLWSRTRATVFFLLYLACELIGLIGAVLIEVVTLGGRHGGPQRYVDLNAGLQRWWSETLLEGGFLIFSMRLEVDGREAATPAPFLLLVRHASTADAVLAASIVANPNKILLKYVLKQELLWDPCLDLVGRRLPNEFIDRSGSASEATLEAVARLGRDLDEKTAVLIYPEGTRFSPAKRERFIERLRSRDCSELVQLAEQMQFVLPPRTGGVLTLLDQSPDLDVVVLAHTGFEGARTFSDFIAGGLVGRTIRVALWRIPARSIPENDREKWLFELWRDVDQWIGRWRQGLPTDPR